MEQIYAEIAPYLIRFTGRGLSGFMPCKPGQQLQKARILSHFVQHPRSCALAASFLPTLVTWLLLNGAKSR